MSARLTLGQRFNVAMKALRGDRADLAAMMAGILPGGRGEAPKRGTREFLEAYSQMPWLRAVMERAADQFVSCRWHAMTMTGSNGRAVRNYQWQQGDRAFRMRQMKALRKAGKLRELENHPILQAIQGGNTYHVGSQVAKLGMLNRDLAGESFEIKERNAFGAPIALWNIPPNWVVETPTPAVPGFRISYRGWNDVIPASEILWQVNPDPANPYGRGTSIARSLSDELDTDDFAAKYMRNRFYNQARPDIVISGKGINATNTRELEDKWVAKSQGFWNVAKPFFTNAEISIQEIGQTNAELQLIDLRKFERDMFIHVVGFPPEVFGITESSNRSTIDAAAYMAGKFVTLPRVEARREFLQQRLVPDYDERIVLEYDSPIDEDKEFDLKVMQAFPWAFDVDQLRELAGDEPLPNGKGKVFMMPFNLTPATSPADAGPPAADPEDDPEPVPAGSTPPGEKPTNEEEA